MSRTLGGRLLELAPGARGWLAALVGVLLATTASYVGQGLLIATALNRVFQGRGLGSLAAPVAGIMALQLVRGALTVGRAGAEARAASEVKRAVRQRLVARLLAGGPDGLQRTRTGTLQSTLVDGVETLDAYVGRFLPQVAAAVLGAAGVTAYLIVLDPVVGAVVLACAMVTAVVPVVSDTFFRDRMRAWIRNYRGLYAENLDAVQGMATLKAFNASRRRGDQLHRQAQEFCRDSVRLTAFVVSYVGVIALLVGIGTAAAVGVGAVRLAGGELSAIGLLIVLLLTREAFRPLNDLEKAYHASYGARPAGEAIFELLDAEPTPAAATLDGKADGTAAAVAPPGGTPPGVLFDHVRFAYQGRDRPALDGFSLEIAGGERVALVGRSGAGKTTVVSLLLRFFTPDEGRVVVGGQDAQAMDVGQLRALVAVVAQDTYLFHGTVRHNLLLAKESATDAELVAAAQAARAHEFITALPDGYDTVVGERGLKLSGGQRQRIAIARALLADAPILVLDEPTSSVDAVNEAAIQEALETLTRDRTTLLIAHRLSTVRSADRVVVLDAGRVVEVGDHAALMSQQGAYAQLVSAQEASR